jgi:hypothetical protein
MSLGNSSFNDVCNRHEKTFFRNRFFYSIVGLNNSYLSFREINKPLQNLGCLDVYLMIEANRKRLRNEYVFVKTSSPLIHNQVIMRYYRFHAQRYFLFFTFFSGSHFWCSLTDLFQRLTGTYLVLW